MDIGNGYISLLFAPRADVYRRALLCESGDGCFASVNVVKMPVCYSIAIVDVAYIPVLPPVTRYTFPLRSGIESGLKCDEGMVRILGRLMFIEEVGIL